MDIRQLKILYLGRNGFVVALVSLWLQTQLLGKKKITLLKIKSYLCFLSVTLLAITFYGCTHLPSSPGSAQGGENVATENPAKPAASFEPDTLYDLLVAEVAGYRQRYDLALGNYLQQAHKTSDPSITAHAYQTAIFIGAWQAAQDAAEFWVSIDPKNPLALRSHAIELARMGKSQAAAEQMLIVLKMKGDANFEFVAITSTDQTQEERDKLIATFDQALKQHPDNSRTQLGKAILLQYSGRNAEAIKLCERIIKQGNNSKAVMLKGELLMIDGRLNDAQRFLSDHVDKAPNNVRLRLLYGRALAYVQQPDLAQEQFEILLAQSPNDPEILLSVGLILMENNMLEDAARCLKRLKGFSRYQSLAELYLGKLAQQQGNWEQARLHYLKVDARKLLMPTYAALAQMLADHEMWSQAVKDLRAARELHPDFMVQLYLMEGEVLIGQRAYEQASGVLDAALKNYPNNQGLLYARAMLAEKTGNLELLEQDLRKILTIDPDNAFAMNALGYTLIDQVNRFAEAKELVTNAYMLKPNDPAIIDSMGWVAFRMKHYKQALQYLRTAYEKMPNADVAAHLGEVLWVKGSRMEAVSIWERALEKQPDSEALKEVMERLQGSE
ncbi:MAG: tetratricopeptide repeat protein [Endozoicomonadaceae bacterium]|nr:tetratricopeptide repeat protein [Endozoicomonadaceae bacterium]